MWTVFPGETPEDLGCSAPAQRLLPPSVANKLSRINSTSFTVHNEDPTPPIPTPVSTPVENALVGDETRVSSPTSEDSSEGRDPVEGVGVGAGTARLALVEGGEGGDLVSAQLEVEDREVLLEPLAAYGLGED